MSETKMVNLFVSLTDGPVLLTPQGVRDMSDEALEEFLLWAYKTQETLLKPRSCPFCGV